MSHKSSPSQPTGVLLRPADLPTPYSPQSPISKLLSVRTPRTHDQHHAMFGLLKTQTSARPTGTTKKNSGASRRVRRGWRGVYLLQSHVHVRSVPPQPHKQPPPEYNTQHSAPSTPPTRTRILSRCPSQQYHQWRPSTTYGPRTTAHPRQITHYQ